METNNLILIEHFCLQSEVDIAFIETLLSHGLIEIVEIKNAKYITPDQVKYVEEIAYMHLELNINLEGIETIRHLLHQICDLQQELSLTKSKLKFFQD